MFDDVTAALTGGEFPGVTSALAHVSGALQLEWYDGAGGSEELRNTRSVTKTVTGILLGIAIDHGHVASVADEVASYLGSRGSGGHDDAPAGVTLEDLLAMRSCLDCDDSDAASPGNEELLYPAPDWLAFARSIPLRRPCGPARFRYCTAHTVLLGATIAEASGATLPEFATRTLFEPLGIERCRWFLHDSGFAFPGGGLELRSRDLLSLGLLYLWAGSWHGSRVVSSDWVERSTTPRVNVDERTSYGYLWWLRTYEVGERQVATWLMLGNGGSKVAVVPGLDAVVVLTATNFGQRGMHQLTDGLLSRVLGTISS